MKVYITTTTAVGQRCADWASSNLPSNTSIVSDMEDCELFFSIFYNKLLSPEFINGRRKCFNFHGGLLPQYRGSGTINWAIINGERESGITLHEIDSQIDHGPIISVRTAQIEERDTAKSLYEKLEVAIFATFKDWFVRLVTLNYSAIPQDHSKAKLYRRADLQNAKDLSRFIRAFEFPGKECAFYINSAGQKVYLTFMDKTDLKHF